MNKQSVKLISMTQPYHKSDWEIYEEMYPPTEEEIERRKTSISPGVMTKELHISHLLNSPNDVIAYTARGSNPSNQENFDTAFEMVDVTFEIVTTRDIGRQILRHKTANFQEFSQRYAEVNADGMFIREARLQDTKNRQNSIECEDGKLQKWWAKEQRKHINNSIALYKKALGRGMAKECARVVLPEGNTPSTMYMKAPLQTWIHYCLLRRGPETQKEHREIATLIFEILVNQFPFLKDIT